MVKGSGARNHLTNNQSPSLYVGSIEAPATDTAPHLANVREAFMGGSLTQVSDGHALHQVRSTTEFKGEK